MKNNLFGKRTEAISIKIKAGHKFLKSKSRAELLGYVGKTIDLPTTEDFDNSFIQNSSRKSDDHFLTGLGLFFITEKGKVILDCTAGHYQMPWGYSSDIIDNAIINAVKEGITWDCHSDIPGNPLKALARELVSIANGFNGLDDPRLDDIVEADGVLNRAIVSTCTGTVACAAAFRMAYIHYENNYSEFGAPVFITWENNYHGTDTFAQAMRGMWPGLFGKDGVEFVQLEPNNLEQVKDTFEKYGKRIACFFYEPVMMNNEALLIKDETVKLMRKLTTEVDAMLVVDEIQSCFFVPELMMFRQYGVVPDAVIVGKGMTGGVHGQSAAVFRKKFDNLAQFDALSTNGNAPMAAVSALTCINAIKENREHLIEMQDLYFNELKKVASEFPELAEKAMGRGLLGGFKFKEREKAIEARELLLKEGLWVRVHAYKKHHRTLLMKFALIIEPEIIDFFFNKVRNVFKKL